MRILAHPATFSERHSLGAVTTRSISVNYDVPCRPTPLPARAPIPTGWRLWSHGDDAAMYRSILGTERPQGVILIERCCDGSVACGHCSPDLSEAATG